jgi:hypothetical protein
MTAAELVKLIHTLHRPSREIDRSYFYQALQAYLIDSDYDWQEHMNDPAEEGIIQSGVYLVWAQDTELGIHFWDTTGKRYLIPFSFKGERDKYS